MILGYTSLYVLFLPEYNFGAECNPDYHYASMLSSTETRGVSTRSTNCFERVPKFQGVRATAACIVDESSEKKGIGLTSEASRATRQCTAKCLELCDSFRREYDESGTRQ